MKFIFDVESDGLYGEGFAFGYVVIDNENNVIKADSYISIEGQKNVKTKWVKENVLPIKCKNEVRNNIELRNKFYEILQENSDCEIWSDVNFPVETNFLRDIVKDDEERAFEMPYPLKDVSTIVDVEIHRINTFNSECECNLVEHNPEHDALASAYLLTKSRSIIEYYENIIG